MQLLTLLPRVLSDPDGGLAALRAQLPALLAPVVAADAPPGGATQNTPSDSSGSPQAARAAVEADLGARGAPEAGSGARGAVEAEPGAREVAEAAPGVRGAVEAHPGARWAAEAEPAASGAVEAEPGACGAADAEPGLEASGASEPSRHQAAVRSVRAACLSRTSVLRHPWIVHHRRANAHLVEMLATALQISSRAAVVASNGGFADLAIEGVLRACFYLEIAVTVSGSDCFCRSSRYLEIAVLRIFLRRTRP